MYQKQHHQQQACTLLYTYMCRVLFFFMGCCPILYVRTWYVSRDPGSYIVRAYLASYCLSVRQQQRFDHPALKPTSVIFLGCLKKAPSAASMYTAVYMCRVFFFCWDVALYCTYVPGMCGVILSPILYVRTWYHTVVACDNNSALTTLH